MQNLQCGILEIHVIEKAKRSENLNEFHIQFHIDPDASPLQTFVFCDF